MNIEVNAASACLPGKPIIEAITRITQGVTEPLWGRLGTQHVQVCPQHPGRITEETVYRLQAIAPGTTFRLHANVFGDYRRHMFDASTFETAEHRSYFRTLASLSQRMKAPAYTLHAGYQHQATLDQMRDNVLAIQDLFGVPVGVEALYPISRRERAMGRMPQLLATWKELEWLMASGLNMAIDLSHIQIIANAEGRRDDLLADLLAHPRLIEVHVSENDHTRDSHDVCREDTWWLPLLRAAPLSKDCVIFSEGNLVRMETKTH